MQTILIRNTCDYCDRNRTIEVTWEEVIPGDPFPRPNGWTFIENGWLTLCPKCSKEHAKESDD